MFITIILNNPVGKGEVMTVMFDGMAYEYGKKDVPKTVPIAIRQFGLATGQVVFVRRAPIDE